MKVEIDEKEVIELAKNIAAEKLAGEIIKEIKKDKKNKESSVSIEALFKEAIEKGE